MLPSTWADCDESSISRVLATFSTVMLYVWVTALCVVVSGCERVMVLVPTFKAVSVMTSPLLLMPTTSGSEEDQVNPSPSLTTVMVGWSPT